MLNTDGASAPSMFSIQEAGNCTYNLRPALSCTRLLLTVKEPKSKYSKCRQFIIVLIHCNQGTLLYLIFYLTYAKQTLKMHCIVALHCVLYSSPFNIKNDILGYIFLLHQSLFKCILSLFIPQTFMKFLQGQGFLRIQS